MALQSATQGAGSVGKTANVLDQNGVFTMMGWLYPTDATASAGHYFWTITNGAGDRYDLVLILDDGAGHRNVVVESNVAGAAQDTAGATAISVNTWYHVALVRTSTTQLLLYVNGVLDATATHANVTGRAASTVQDVLRFAQGRVAGYKAWSTNLTAAEVAQEALTLRPHRIANLNAWCPVFPGSGENVRDYSRTQDLTITGTLTDADPPPVSYGAPVLWIPIVTLAMQYARPDADVSVGTWTTDTGATTNLFQAIDETPASDTDYIQSVTDPSAAAETTGLGDVTDPVSSTGHIVRYRVART